MKKNITLLLVGVIIVVGLGYLLTTSNETSDNKSTTAENAIGVAVSTDTIQEMVERVGGEYVAITSAPATGVSSHDYEPTPKQVQAIYDSQLFVFNGAGLDTWAEELHEELTETDTLELSAFVTLLTADGHDHEVEETHEHGDEEDAHDHDHDSVESEDDHEDAHDDEDHEHEEDEDAPEHSEETEDDHHDHDHGEFDPHIWLDPQRYILQVEAVRDALTRVDSSNADIYSKNAASYIEEVEQLHQVFLTGLEQCERRDIIVGHDSFGYLGDRYDLTIHSISGVDPEAGISAKTLAELTELVEEHGITTVFYDDLVDNKASAILATEAGVDTEVLHPIEGLTLTQQEAGATYISLMEENLDHLRSALDCQ